MNRVLPSPETETPLLAWLLETLKPMSRTRVKELLKHGHVRVNNLSVTQFDHPVQPGDVLVLGPATKATPTRITIAYEDDAVIVLDKPCGLLSVASESEKTDTAFVRLRDHLDSHRAGRPFVVHRLDRETSGLLLFARSVEIRDRLQTSWDAVEKTYLAVVEGKPRPASGTVSNFLLEGRDLRVRAVQAGGEAKQASSRYRVLGTDGPRSVVEVVLETGRKHQIRVHLAGLHCPVVGDKLYGAKTDPARRLGLHAHRLAFLHPTTGERVDVQSPLPDSLRRLVRMSSEMPPRRD